MNFAITQITALISLLAKEGRIDSGFCVTAFDSDVAGRMSIKDIETIHDKCDGSELAYIQTAHSMGGSVRYYTVTCEVDTECYGYLATVYNMDEQAVRTYYSNTI